MKRPWKTTVVVVHLALLAGIGAGLWGSTRARSGSKLPLAGGEKQPPRSAEINCGDKSTFTPSGKHSTLKVDNKGAKCKVTVKISCDPAPDVAAFDVAAGKKDAKSCEKGKIKSVEFECDTATKEDEVCKFEYDLAD
jgi:hypothetical protein